MILLTAFSLNMVFANGKCMLFPKCCRVSLGFLPWKPLFPVRQDISVACKRSCGNSPFGFFPLLGAGWSQEKAGAWLQGIDGFPALRSLRLRCGGKCPSLAAEEGSC